jgi:hypothetical protein
VSSTIVRRIPMNSCELSQWWGKARLLLLLLVVTLWPIIAQCSVTTTGRDDDCINNHDDENDIAMDALTNQQYYRPHSLNLGVPQILNGLDNNDKEIEEKEETEEEDDDDDNDESSNSVHRFSPKKIKEYMEETEEYFRTNVLNVLKPEQVERCKDYHESCVVWRLVGTTVCRGGGSYL